MLLEVRNLSKRFGGLQALARVNLSLEEGMIASLIGPNGAGKTTLFNTLTGLYRPDEGEICFLNRSLVGLKPDKITGAGISRTFQARNRPRARRRAETVAARRADRRDEYDRGGRADDAFPETDGAVRPGDSFDRAQHAGGDGHFAPSSCP